MKKNQKIILFIVVILIGVSAFLILKPESMASQFKKEYESLNGKKTESGKKYLDVSVDGNKIVYASYSKIFEVLNTTGVIYFGFPECPWCRNAMPVLLEAADEVGIDKIYYMNNKDDRDIKSLKDNKVVIEKEGSSNYNKLLKKLGKNASVYEGLNDDSIKRLYFPTVVVVKEGKIVDYIMGTVDSQTDPYKALNSNQRKELKNKYVKAMKKILSCSSEKKC